MNTLKQKPRKRSSKSTPKSSLSQAKLIQSTISLVEEKGFGGVSLREVCTRSGQNLASISYHFGNKDALFATIINGYHVDLANQWSRNLKHYLENLNGDTPKAPAIIGCLIEPYIMHQDSTASLKLHRAMFTHCLMQKNDQLPLNLPKVKATIDLIITALMASQPHLSNKQANRLVRLSIGATINTLVLEANENDGQTAMPMTSRSRKNLLDRLSAFCSSHITQQGTL